MMTRLTQPFRVLTAFLLLTGAALPGASVGASEPIAWRFAHPEAQILAGVDFRKLDETADGRQVRDQFVAALGTPILEKAERLLLSSVVESNGKRSDVLVLSGSFSLSQLRRLANSEGAKMVSYKGLDIAAPPGAAIGDPHLAWITGPGGATTVLIGTRPAIQAAVERSKAHLESLASVNPLFGRARDLGASYPIWVTCETLPGGFGPAGLDSLSEERINGFDVAIQPGNAANLSLWIRTVDESSADAALQQMQLAAGGREVSVLTPWLTQLKGAIEESTLVLGAPIAEGAVADRIGPILAAFALPVDIKSAKAAPDLALRAKLVATVPMSGVPVFNGPAAAYPAAPPPKKMFVRIEGLDDGVRDIPYSAKP